MRKQRGNACSLLVHCRAQHVKAWPLVDCSVVLIRVGSAKKRPEGLINPEAEKRSASPGEHPLILALHPGATLGPTVAETG
jgi:hypothetical protein